MKRGIRLLIVVIGVLSLSSCAIHSGYMNNSASLSQANFSYKKTSISGTASTLQVLGIGGLGKSAIVGEAKQNMLRNNPLKQNQALANITVNWKNSFYFLVMTTECTVTADVVEFYSENKSAETIKTLDPQERDIVNDIIKKDLVFEKGYKGIVEFGGQFGIGDYGLSRLKLDIINGYQLNEYFSLGLGTGIRIYESGVLVPIYADFRANYISDKIENTKIVPYFSLGMGYSLELDGFRSGGFILKPDVGVSFKISETTAMNIGLGYEMQKVGYYNDHYYYGNNTIESRNIGAFNISVGVSF